jgi:diguanylate cyclase (GGDEF)-like protein
MEMSFTPKGSSGCAQMIEEPEFAVARRGKTPLADPISALVDSILLASDALDVRVEDIGLSQYEDYLMREGSADAGQGPGFSGEKLAEREWRMAKLLALQQVQTRSPTGENSVLADLSLNDAENRIRRGLGFINVTNRRSVIKFTLLTTLYSIGLSVGGLFLLAVFTDMDRFRMGLAPSILFPLLIAPLISYTNLQNTLLLNEATKKIEALSRTDALTGLNNKRFFLELAEREMVIADRYNFHASIFVIDLDFFKVVNDTYGHLAGDQVLKEVAQIITQEVRRTDIAGRFGGEELVVFLPHTTCEQALRVAERIRSGVEENVVHFTAHEISVTASIGVTSTESGVKNLGKMIHVADAALYQAKSSGRNRVVSSLDSLEGTAYTSSLISM